MNWGAIAAHFFSGAFLANSIPHIVHGISGSRFQSPFARPPGIGESSAIVNVLWGAFNLAVGYLLIMHFGFEPIAAGIGALVLALWLAHHFGRVRNKSA
ncbi:MAG TPA: hypothetical protein VK779_03785 [Rhizomicrobium sp.]|jgi:hypothetical protein|nr:hypothetical protein [Rhizomicrobium sp.]